MRIGEVIRKYRKEQNMTQEEVANFLGVTAPAVNKWENGISYPDITLLAPLARILRIDVDTLVSFREEITDAEINRISENIYKEAMNEGYEETFEKVKNIIREYPNCNKLIFFLAQQMNFQLTVQGIEDKEKYEKQIDAWFEAVALCKDESVSNMAIVMLCQRAIADKAFEKAQKLLDKIPPLGMDKRLQQANLYIAQEEDEKAYKVYEEMLFQNATGLVMNLMCLCQMKCRENAFGAAEEFAALARRVAEEFSLGTYTEANTELAVAVEMKDKEKTLRLMKEMFGGLGREKTMNSKLYTHLEFKSQEGLESLKRILKRGFEKDEELDFVRDEPAFRKIMEELARD